MEYQKKADWLDSTSNQPPLDQKIGLKQLMNEEEHAPLINKLNLKHQC